MLIYSHLLPSPGHQVKAFRVSHTSPSVCCSWGRQGRSPERAREEGREGLPWECGFTSLFTDSCILVCTQLLEHCLTHSRCSRNLFNGYRRPDKAYLSLLRTCYWTGFMLITSTFNVILKPALWGRSSHSCFTEKDIEPSLLHIGHGKLLTSRFMGWDSCQSEGELRNGLSQLSHFIDRGNNLITEMTLPKSHRG